MSYSGSVLKQRNGLSFWEYVACLLLAVIVIIPLYAVPVYIAAYFEASAYERVTGKHVATWDAIWLDLRVQEGASDDTD